MRTFIVSLLACAALLPAAQPPQQAKQQPKPFAILRPNGETPISLASYRGKVVALIFISTTCPHCQEFTRELAPMAQEYGPRGVQFLECAVNPDAAKLVAGFIKDYQPPFPVGYNTQAAVDEYLDRSVLMTFYVPHVVLLNRNGRVVGDYAGESDFMKNPVTNTRAELDKMLAAPPPIARKAAGAAKTPAPEDK
jgi:thiol-disulfide isomerase/thioredoxin